MSKPNEATATLLKLAAENPTMPIVAMVNFEVVAGDEFAYWTGEIDSVDVKELWLSPDARTWDREDAESEWDGFIESYASNEDLMKSNAGLTTSCISRLPWNGSLGCHGPNVS